MNGIFLPSRSHSPSLRTSSKAPAASSTRAFSMRQFSNRVQFRLRQSLAGRVIDLGEAEALSKT